MSASAACRRASSSRRLTQCWSSTACRCACLAVSLHMVLHHVGRMPSVMWWAWQTLLTAVSASPHSSGSCRLLWERTDLPRFCSSDCGQGVECQPEVPLLQGKRVVRLKGGCPSTFSRVSGEMTALTSAGVPFQLVPGVSSATAAPVLAGEQSSPTTGLPAGSTRIARRYSYCTFVRSWPKRG